MQSIPKYTKVYIPKDAKCTKVSQGCKSKVQFINLNSPKVAKIQICKVTKLLCYEVANLRIWKVANMQSCKITTLVTKYTYLSI